MKMKTRLYIKILISIVALTMSCEEDKDLYKKKFTDESSLLITEYLAGNENTEMMVELLEASGKDALLNTYGNYTVFAPTDSAFSMYLSSIGKSKISDLDESEVNALIDFHVILNLIDIKTKVTGVLGGADTTISGIRHFIDLSQGFGSIRINKNALITSIVETSNGIVYVMDNVLEPHPNNIYDYLESSGEYTIFTAAIDAVGIKDTLQKVEYPFPYSDIDGLVFRPYYTLFVEPDDLFKANGINSVDDLKNSVWNSNDSEATNADEALRDFVNYHLISGQRSTFSFTKEENLTTLGINKSGIIHLDEPTDINIPDPVLNSAMGNGGVKLSLMNSDVSCINGLVHQIQTNILYVNQNYVPTTITRECEDEIIIYPTTDGNWFMSEDFFYGGRGGLDYTINQQFYASSGSDIGYALAFYPSDNGDWIEFLVRNIVPGNYQVKINFYRDEGNSSEDVNIYFRNSNDEFSWETQLFLAGFDMAFRGSTNPPPNYRQDYNLGTVTIEEYGNYVFRFAHVDTKYGVYDNIVLVPIEEE